MIRKFYNRTILWVFTLGWLCFSCSFNSDEYDFDRIAEVQWNPEYAIPLVSGSLSIMNLLGSHDSLALQQKEDGMLYFIYEDILESRDLNDIIVVPNHSFQKNYYVLSPVVVPADGSREIFNSQETIDLSNEPELEHEQLYEAHLKYGFIDYVISAENSTHVDVEISFPTIKNAQGDPLYIIENISEDGGTITGTASLAGYVMDLSTLTPGNNRFPMVFKVTANGGTSGAIVPLSDNFSLNVDFREIDYTEMRGFFGNQTVTLPEENVKIGPFTDLADAEIVLGEANITLEVINDYRIPSQVDFQIFTAEKESGSVDITTTPATPIIINVPTSATESASTFVAVDEPGEIFNFRPEWIRYLANATINFTNQNIENFIKDTDRLKIKLTAETPLYGSAKGIHLYDTLDVDIDSDINEDEVTKALMKLSIVNEFPIQAAIQIYFADENYQVVDSLFTTVDEKNIIVPSKVDASGYLISNGEGKYDQLIEITGRRLTNLMDASYIILKTDMSTIKNGDSYPLVRFKADYKMYVDMGIQTKLNLSLKP